MANNKSRVEILENKVDELQAMMEELEAKLAKVKSNGNGKGLFGGKRTPTPVKDTTTGIIYATKSACGKALAGEADSNGADNFAWYKLIAKFPKRFVVNGVSGQ